MIPPAAEPAVVWPAHDRLYTIIIGRLKRGMSIIALSAGGQLRIAGHRRDAEIQRPGGHAGMNAPVSRESSIEATRRGRRFGAQWRPAVGGSLDALEPATGAVITRVGNATAEDVRQAAAEARAAQPAMGGPGVAHQRAAILRKAAVFLEDNQR